MLTVGDLIRLFLEKAHCVRYSIYPGTTKMYDDLSKHYWWCSMKRDILEFVVRCLTCVKVKYEHLRLGEELHRLPIAEYMCKCITIDFVVG